MLSKTFSTWRHVKNNFFSFCCWFVSTHSVCHIDKICICLGWSQPYCVNIVHHNFLFVSINFLDVLLLSLFHSLCLNLSSFGCNQTVFFFLILIYPWSTSFERNHLGIWHDKHSHNKLILKLMPNRFIFRSFFLAIK